MPNTQLDQEVMGAFADVISELCISLNRKDLDDKLWISFGKLLTKNLSDGRKTAWSDARKAKHQAKFASAIEKRKAETTIVLYFYQYKNAPPKKLIGYEAITNSVGIQEQMLKKLLKKDPDGFIRTVKNRRAIYAKDDAAFDRLVYSEYVKSNNPDDIIVLPYKDSPGRY